MTGVTRPMETSSKIAEFRVEREERRAGIGDQALEWLLSPLSVEQFLAEIWEKRPHVIERNDRTYYDGLFGPADLDTVLEYGRPRPPEMRVVMDGEGVVSDKFVQSDGRLDLNQLRRLYAEGHTIVIHGLHRFWNPVAAFVQALEHRVSFGVTPNTYLTPSGSRGLNPHFDTHDVIVAQLWGAKTWRIYFAAEVCPLLGTIPEQSFVREELPDPRVIELTEGDAIYIPRGWVHEAETTDQSSLHLTLGFHPPQWHDFIVRALTDLTLKNERLRRAVPVGYLNDRDAVRTLGVGLRELAELLEREGSAADALGMLEDEFIRRGRAVPDGQFVAGLDSLPSIDLKTRLVKRPYLYCRVVPAEDSVALQFSRSVVRGPLDYADAMAFVAESHAPFAVSDLPIAEEERRISLAQRLVRDGLLNFAT